jgi:nucleotide-binding universal stress UspA family protein
MPRFQKILHPTDFSEHASHAFKLACSLARDAGAKLILLHVHYVPMVTPAEVPPPYQPEESPEVLWERLRAIQPENPEVAVEYHMRVGDVADEIISQAQVTQSDLIVMGTHGRTGLSRLLMGSVAEKVLRRAPCPVLTVKHPFPEAKPPARPPAQTDTPVSVS